MPFYIEAVTAQKRSQLGQRRPRGEVVFLPGTADEEHIVVPAAVASAMARKLAAEEIEPRSRAEALWLIKDISRACAVSRVEGLVNRRDYAEGEIRAKLREDGYSAKVVEEVVEKARRGHVIDDRRFADVFIRTKVSAGWGRRRIERELSLKGIDAAVVPGWPDDYIDEGDERDRAYRLASRRRLTGKNDYAKIVRFLVGRGFGMSDAKDAAARVLREAETDARD